MLHQIMGYSIFIGLVAYYVWALRADYEKNQRGGGGHL